MSAPALNKTHSSTHTTSKQASATLLALCLWPETEFTPPEWVFAYIKVWLKDKGTWFDPGGCIQDPAAFGARRILDISVALVVATFAALGPEFRRNATTLLASGLPFAFLVPTPDLLAAKASWEQPSLEALQAIHLPRVPSPSQVKHSWVCGSFRLPAMDLWAESPTLFWRDPHVLAPECQALTEVAGHTIHALTTQQSVITLAQQIYRQKSKAHKISKTQHMDAQRGQPEQQVSNLLTRGGLIHTNLNFCRNDEIT